MVRGLMFDAEPMRKASLAGRSISESALAVLHEQAIPCRKKEEKGSLDGNKNNNNNNNNSNH